jgi:CRISPR-associated protein Cmr1
VSGEDEPGARAKPDQGGVPPVPTSLPPRHSRASRRGPTRTTIDVSIEVVTPILGGAAQTRELDESDVIRPATVRGHLRFWWRALHGHEKRFEDTADLYAAESALWGRAAKEHTGGRSAVELRVDVQRRAGIDASNVHPTRTQGAYALWPAREERRKLLPPAPRWNRGTQFRLRLEVPNDSGRAAEVRAAVQAWILFGGYGSRTRRGLGSLQVIDTDHAWLPSEAKLSAFEACFGSDIFSPPDRAVGDTPWLAGAKLHVGKAERDAERAWLTALEWLKEFRQGPSGARQPGKSGRHSISNWPEADKVRWLSRPNPKNASRWAHTPRHNATPAWPRAGFGLPIVGQFQELSRELRPGWRPGDRAREYLHWHELPPNHPNHGDEPEPFELCWQSHTEDGRRVPQERLASPLIVKALPLTGGRFVPCALWLHREYPRDGEVVLLRKQSVVRASEAPFDRLVAKGDAPRFAALDPRRSLRDAFLDWLHATYQTTRIKP